MDALTGISASRFGAYIHFPYCLAKCPYCDFASTAAKRVPMRRYTDAIVAEVALRVEPLRGRRLESLYFGGGTPSLWEPAELARVIEAMRANFDFDDDCEVTLEANPGASDAARFRSFRELGVNRLSLGIQSLSATTLKALGRNHSPDDARAAVAAAREAGFDNLSVDFIYGCPRQTVDEARADAQAAVALQPEHLSAYALTLDNESLAQEVPLGRAVRSGLVALPPDDDVVAMQREYAQACEAAGLHRYEVSNYARAGLHSRHNALYWTQGEYFALGTGATGTVVRSPEQRVRYSNIRDPLQYMEAVEASSLPNADLEVLGRDELFSERVAMGLRLTNGVDVARACEEFHLPYAARRDALEQLARLDLVTFADNRWALTPRGFDVHSEVSARLL